MGRKRHNEVYWQIGMPGRKDALENLEVIERGAKGIYEEKGMFAWSALRGSLGALCVQKPWRIKIEINITH